MLCAQGSSHVTSKHFSEALHLSKVWSGEGTFLAWRLFGAGSGPCLLCPESLPFQCAGSFCSSTDRCSVCLSVPPPLNRWCKGAWLGCQSLCSPVYAWVVVPRERMLSWSPRESSAFWSRCCLCMSSTWAASGGSGGCLPSCCLPAGYVSQLVGDFTK